MTPEETQRLRDAYRADPPDCWFEENRKAEPEEIEVRVETSPRTNGVPTVVYRPLACPFCRSSHTVVTHTTSDTVRRHQCRQCQGRFKSRCVSRE